MKKPQIDLPEFIAFALALEKEAAERSDEIADSLDQHNNKEVCALFRELALHSRQHHDDIARHAEGITLPRLRAWDFCWVEGEGPETTPLDDIHYLMTPHHALTLALRNEKRGYDYYDFYAKNAESQEVRKMAAEMATEEAGHVLLLQEWIKRYPTPDAHWNDDPDPPVLSE